MAALVSTASAINANLYAVTNVAFRMATYGELPAAFGRPVRRSREGLVISAGVVMLLVPTLNLTALAVIGSLTILVVHVAVHVGHWRLAAETGASRTLLAAAIVANVGVIATVLGFEFRDAPGSIARLLAFVGAAVVLEVLFRWYGGRRLHRRHRMDTGAHTADRTEPFHV